MVPIEENCRSSFRFAKINLSTPKCRGKLTRSCIMPASLFVLKKIMPFIITAVQHYDYTWVAAKKKYTLADELYDESRKS